MSDRSVDQLKAADIMQKKVVVVAPEDSLQEVMDLITENHVTGLPVLDAKDRCIGLVSASDILGFVDEQAEATSSEDVGRYFNPDEYRWEQIGVAAFSTGDYGDTPVAEIMSRELIAVNPDAPVREVALLMEDKKVHRVLVLDDDRKLHGIISSFDFVRMIAAADDM